MTTKILGAIILLLISVFLILFVTSYKTQDLTPKNPNIVLIDICSARPDHFSFIGYSRKTTPNIDALAQKSFIFENTWTESTWCLPNFATILTGTRSIDHKMFIRGESKLPENLNPLASILSGRGYETHGFSGSQFLTGTHNLQKGFDTFINPYDGEKHGIMGTVSLEENLPEILSFLDRRRRTLNPFFLYVTVDDLHAPYHSDNPHFFDKESHGVLDTYFSGHNEDNRGGVWFERAYNGEDLKDKPELVKAALAFKKDARGLEHLAARYDAALHRSDRLVGQILDKLSQDKFMDNTVIIITAHQGESLGEHGIIGHSEGIYEQVLRVPLLIYYPRFGAKRVSDFLAERIDVPKTIIDIIGAGNEYPDQFSGVSLLPMISGQDSNLSKDYVFSFSKPVRNYGNPQSTEIQEAAIRDARYKLIWYEYKKNQYELYDLENDPGETKNLVRSEPKILERLKLELDKKLRLGSYYEK